jgi:selenocysteine lyase/cysteine desulfurase
MYSGMTPVDAGVISDGGRPLFAELIGGKTKEIAFVENTSMGLNIAAGVLDFKKKPAVGTADFEYSSVIYILF